MKQQQIGLTNIKSSQYILGTWAFGDKYWGDFSHKDAVKTIHAAFRAGINHFDTSPVYGNGIAEQLIGQQLRKDRTNYIISTKSLTVSPDKLHKQIDTSLKRLFTDYIDIFYIHWPSCKVDSLPMFLELLKLKQQGVIRAIGVSNFSIEKIADLQKFGHIDIIQDCYNLIWRKPEQQLIPFSIDTGAAFASYSPLAQGILTGRYPHFTPVNKINHFRGQTVFHEPRPKKYIITALNNFNKLARELQIQPSALALKWLETRPSSPFIIFGARNRKQLEQNLGAEDLEIPADALAQLDSIFLTSSKKIPEDAQNIFRHKF